MKLEIYSFTPPNDGDCLPLYSIVSAKSPRQMTGDVLAMFWWRENKVQFFEGSEDLKEQILSFAREFARKRLAKTDRDLNHVHNKENPCHNHDH